MLNINKKFTWFAFDPLQYFSIEVITINIFENRSDEGIGKTKHENIISKSIFVINIVFDESISNNRNQNGVD